MGKLCDTCVYRDNTEYFKPCIIYRDDCELYEKERDEMNDDLISRQAVLDITWEEPSYTDALNVLTEVRDKVKSLPPVRPQEPVLDKIREEIKTLSNANPSYWHSGDMVEREEVFEIIDKYRGNVDEI